MRRPRLPCRARRSNEGAGITAACCSGAPNLYAFASDHEAQPRIGVILPGRSTCLRAHHETRLPYRATTEASTSCTEPGHWRGFVAKQVTGLVPGPFTGSISGFLPPTAGMFLIVGRG